MNKKGLFIIILCLTLFFISGCDQEQTGTDEGTDKIYQILTQNSLIQGLFGADKNLAEDIVIMRMLFAILIFAIIYGTSEIALKGIARNARIAIGIIIAIISVIAVPEKLFLGVAQAYGGFIMFIMMGIPVFIGLFLIFKVFKEPTRFNYTAKFAIAALLFYISGRFAKDSLIGVSEAFGTIGGVWGGISSITAFASSMFLLMAIYFFIRIFTAESTAATSAQAGLEGAAKQVEGLKKGARRLKRSFRRGVSYDRNIKSNLEKAQKVVEKAGGDKNPVSMSDDIKKPLDDAYSRAETMLGIENNIRRFEEEVERIAHAEHKENIKKDLEVFVNKLRKDLPALIKEINGLRNATTIQAKQFKSPIEKADTIEESILALQALNIRIG